MKVSEYIRRYYAGFQAKDDAVFGQMINALRIECKAEYDLYINSQKRKGAKPDLQEVLRVTDKYNRKGNVIADAFNKKAIAENGAVLLKDDWFKRVLKLDYNQEEDPGANDDDNPENWD